jgi:voltage-gated potassium channel
VLIITGFGVLAYGAGTATAFIVEGHLISGLRRRKMDRQIANLKDHIIICGAGNTGRHIIEELQKTKRDFVVLEQDSEVIDQMPDRIQMGEFLYVTGDATDDDRLRQAGIERAHGLIAALGSDKDNLFVVVAARSLNPGFRIISRAIAIEARSKLLSAGANAVVSPEAIGGLRMASEMIRPTVVTFLDKMLRSGKGDLRIEEALVLQDCELVGRRLEEARVPEKTGTIIVAIKKAGSEEFTYNPPKGTCLEAGDILIAMGEVDQMRKLRCLGGSPH